MLKFVSIYRQQQNQCRNRKKYGSEPPRDIARASGRNFAAERVNLLHGSTTPVRWRSVGVRQVASRRQAGLSPHLSQIVCAPRNAVKDLPITPKNASLGNGCCIRDPQWQCRCPRSVIERAVRRVHGRRLRRILQLLVSMLNGGNRPGFSHATF